MGRRMVVRNEMDIWHQGVFSSIQMALAADTLLGSSIDLTWGCCHGVITSLGGNPVTIVVHEAETRDWVDIWAFGLDQDGNMRKGQGSAKRLHISEALRKVGPPLGGLTFSICCVHVASRLAPSLCLLCSW